MKEKYSPMMMQYLKIKEENKDAIVMFRLGDFYEMFFDDAIEISKVLNLALTGKNAGAKERVPMCGVPHHAADGYIQKLIDLGYKVAIVEQLSDPSKKGIVKREVVQIITPGTIFSLEDTKNNYIGALGVFDFNYTLAYCDISTGEFYVMNIDKNEHDLNNQLDALGIKELVVEDKDLSFENILMSYYDNNKTNDKYLKLFDNINDLKQIKMCSLLLNYMIETQRRDLQHIQKIVEIKSDDYMVMDSYTKKALELTKNSQNETYGTLLWLLDKTKSAMGSRLLKQWIDHPLIKQEEIEKRLDIVEIFVDNFIERETIKDMINEIYDIEKLSARIAFGNVNARDLKWIASSLKVIPEIKYQLTTLDNPYLNELADQLVDLSYITDTIDQAIIDDPPLSVKEGGIIKDGYNEELDQLRYVRDNGKQWLSDFEARERERTGIKGLKVGYNRVFGYYIEVSKSNLSLIKEEYHYTRKQSLTSAERFTTTELKEMEDQILSANDRIAALEYEIFVQLRDYIKKDVHLIQDVAKVIASIDVYQSLACVASELGYVRPSFNNEHRFDIEEGRHGIIEKAISRKNYVANDLHMTNGDPILLITGPNMGGKSTYMRQNALIVIMAQIGSFVPCSKADLPVFDQLFTRIGASDDLISGQSTFMVEMLEANNALRYASEDSLILFDEIGRGTSTYDGMAIAQAMIEYISKHIHCLTLFSTHYHELTMLEDCGIQNVHAAATVENDTIVFLYKIRPGRAQKSYGINVAKLAKLPDEVIERASLILDNLENNDEVSSSLQETSKVEIEVKESEVEKALKAINPMELSPLDALSTLIELKKMI